MIVFRKHVPARQRRGIAARERRSRRGQSLVELALLLPLLSLILVGTLDLGRAFFYYTRLTNAVYAGASYGVKNPSAVTSSSSLSYGDPSDPNNITYRVKSETGLANSDITVTVTCYQGPAGTSLRGNGAAAGTCSESSGVQSGDIIQVTATASFRPITSRIIAILPQNYRLKKSIRMMIIT